MYRLSTGYHLHTIYQYIHVLYIYIRQFNPTVHAVFEFYVLADISPCIQYFSSSSNSLVRIQTHTVSVNIFY